MTRRNSRPSPAAVLEILSNELALNSLFNPEYLSLKDGEEMVEPISQWLPASSITRTKLRRRPNR